MSAPVIAFDCNEVRMPKFKSKKRGYLMKVRDLFLSVALTAALIAPAAAADMNTKTKYPTKAPPKIVEQSSPWQIRVRALGVLPNTSGTSVNTSIVGGAAVSGASSPNAGLSASNSLVPELDISYYFSKNWAAELILGVAPSNINGTGTLASIDAGRVWMLPPTLTFQYHFTDFGAFQPYIGAGVNYTAFFNQKAGNSLWTGTVPGVGTITETVTSLHVKDTFGLATQVGFDYMIDQHWGFNVDAKWIYLEPSYTAGAIGSAPLTLTGTAHLNPWLVGTGLTYRF